jgi:hypothetical protein
MIRDPHPETGFARSGEGPDRTADAALDAALDVLRPPAPSDTLVARLKRLPLPVAAESETGAGLPHGSRPWRYAAVAAALVLIAATGVLLPARGPLPVAPKPVASAPTATESGFAAVSGFTAESGFGAAGATQLPATLGLVGGFAAAEGFELSLIRANAPAGDGGRDGFSETLEAMPLN